ncbi:MAG TPA: hypothetical protein VNZ05_06235 [Solirubrobacteraceae bacterium]|jgi:hypothetical protein|nr:hypothetical protein [Solirubrobacteraceae bacterium]
MSAFLSSVRADLFDRRLRVVLLLLVAGLVGGLAYALTGASGSSSTPTASFPVVSSGAPGIAPVAAAANPNQAVAETTSGSAQQRGGVGRNPFLPLPGAVSKSSSASKGSSSSTSKGASGKSGSTSPSASTTTPSTPSKPSAPAKPKPVYHVSVAFGEIPAGTAPQAAKLTPYEDLKLAQKLPSPEKRVLAFNGVEKGGKRAKFMLVGEALLRGTAVCLPAPTQCQEIALVPGQSEELEYLPPTGPPVVYELQLVSITSTTATTAAVRGIRTHMAHGKLVAEPVASGASLWRRHLRGDGSRRHEHSLAH